MTVDQLSAQQVASDIDAFTSRYVEPWRRREANDVLFALFCRWRDDALATSAAAIERAFAPKKSEAAA